MIREGFDKDLDEIRQTADSGKVFLRQLEEKEIPAAIGGYILCKK